MRNHVGQGDVAHERRIHLDRAIAVRHPAGSLQVRVHARRRGETRQWGVRCPAPHAANRNLRRVPRSTGHLDSGRRDLPADDGESLTEVANAHTRDNHRFAVTHRHLVRSVAAGKPALRVRRVWCRHPSGGDEPGADGVDRQLRRVREIRNRHHSATEIAVTKQQRVLEQVRRQPRVSEPCLDIDGWSAHRPAQERCDEFPRERIRAGSPLCMRWRCD